MTVSNFHPTIAAVIGSLRMASFNRAVFDATREVLADRASLREVSVADLPFFNQDIEEAGDPASVVALKAAVGAADGLIIFTPEYNRSMPAVTKNTVDWLSRPFMSGPIAASPVGIVGSSPGGGDAGGSRAHLAVAVAGAGGVVHEPSLGISGIAGKLTGGVVTDQETRSAIADWASGFLAFVEATSASSEVTSS
jgi:chromate reductase